MKTWFVGVEENIKSCSGVFLGHKEVQKKWRTKIKGATSWLLRLS